MAEYKLTDLISGEVKINTIQSMDTIIVDVVDLNNLLPYLKWPNQDEQYAYFVSEFGLHADLLKCEIIRFASVTSEASERIYYDTLLFSPIKKQTIQNKPSCTI